MDTTTREDDHSQNWLDARLLKITGATAADFLQGYVTCDTSRLSSSGCIPMAICTVKGRVLASGWLLSIDDDLGLIIHASLIDAVAKFLKPYAMFSKCSLVEEPAPVRISRKNQPSPGAVLFDNVHIDFQPADDNLETSDCSHAMQRKLVEAAFVFVSAPVSEQFLPQMLGLDKKGAVDFDKGCYLGQEIVARAQFRGAVKRTVVGFEWQDHAPDVGSDWQGMGAVVAVADNGQGLVCTKNKN